MNANLNYVIDRIGVKACRLELLFRKPKSGKADEIGSKRCEMLLEAVRLGVSDHEVMHLEGIFLPSWMPTSMV